MVDIWAGEVREALVHMPLEVTNPHIYFDRSWAMVCMEGDNRPIYGDIEKKVEYESTKGPIMTYLVGVISTGQRQYSIRWIGQG